MPNEANSNKNTKLPTKQGRRKPSVGRGGVPTPPGFEAHPERRHNGAWKKENTLRFKWEKIIEMDEAELKEVLRDPKCGRVEQMTAEVLLDRQMKPTEKIAVLDKLATQIYGQPKQKIEQTVIAPKPLIDLTERNKNGS
jgi:hypothetical protein